MITNLNTENLSNELLKVFVSIFLKLLTMPFGIEIAYKRVLKSQEFVYKHEITSEISTEHIHFDFTKNVNISLKA